MAHSVTHSNAAKAAATDAVTALIGASGLLKFRITNTAGAAAATLALATDAFGDANGTTGIATAGTITADTNAAGNATAVAAATLETSGGTMVIGCTVGADSGYDIALTNGLTIAAGDTVSCSSLTYQALTA